MTSEGVKLARPAPALKIQPKHKRDKGYRLMIKRIRESFAGR